MCHVLGFSLLPLLPLLFLDELLELLLRPSVWTGRLA